MGSTVNQTIIWFSLWCAILPRPITNGDHAHNVTHALEYQIWACA